jgi:hypothetical protein
VEAGDVVLSHAVSRAVPSAQRGLTTVFGMGTGVALAPLPPAMFVARSGVLPGGRVWPTCVWKLEESALRASRVVCSYEVQGTTKPHGRLVPLG